MFLGWHAAPESNRGLRQRDHVRTLALRGSGAAIHRGSPAALPRLRISLGARRALDRNPLRSSRAQQRPSRSEEHTSELQSPDHLVCRLLLEKKTIVTCIT